MTRRRTAVGSFLLALLLSLPALAQEAGEQEKPAGGEPPAEVTPAAEPPAKTTPDLVPQTVTPVVAAQADSKQSWKDIVVLPRKPFLKRNRVEFMPYFGVTMNDNLIQHYTLGGEINYFLTDILSVGVSGRYYFKHVLDNEFYTRYQVGRVPSINKYIYTAMLNFSYVPFYGKFALLNKRIMHYETYVSAGLGNSATSIIPRDYKNQGFTNDLALSFRMPAIGARFFLTDWMAFHFQFEGIGMIDHYEPAQRTSESGAEAKSQSTSDFVYNFMFNLGVSFFLPTSFKYTTFR